MFRGELREQILLSSPDYDLECQSDLDLKILIARVSAPYLIVHIRDVHDELQIELKIGREYPPYYVRRDVVPGMSKVGIVIYRRSAGVPCHLLSPWIQRNKWLLALR